MKKYSHLLFLGGLLAGVLLLCTSYSPGYYYSYTPYYMKSADLRQSVVYENEPREMEVPKKIYVKGDKIYISEQYQGVHVINNTDPTEPFREAFIRVPGCVDMAVKGDVMYLDNAVDLVAFDLVEKKVTSRIKDFFPPPISPDGDMVSYHPEDEYIPVGWRKR